MSLQTQFTPLPQVRARGRRGGRGAEEGRGAVTAAVARRGVTREGRGRRRGRPGGEHTTSTTPSSREGRHHQPGNRNYKIFLTGMFFLV